MKNYLIPLLCFFFVIGCQKALFRPTRELLSKDAPISTKGYSPNRGTNVSMKDMEAYLHFKDLAFGKIVESVEPVSRDGDTLFYIVNYNEGWELVAADKRAPVLLASGEKGSFSMETENVEMLSWIECLADEVKSLKHKDDFSSCTEEEMEKMQLSRKFWGLICCEADYINTPLTRFDTLPVLPSGGHYILMGVSHTTEIYDDIKLTQTSWGQTSNYCNYYCPFRTDTTYYRAPAGCVPVAGAQMLYFLHNQLSVPVNAPDTASCSGYVGVGNYTQDISLICSATTWNYMLNNSFNDKGYRSAAVLIADVGKKIGVTYGNLRSSSSMSNLPGSVFVHYGISCSSGGFSVSTINQSVLSGMPVLIRADGLPNGTDGHCFIIDGYRRYRAVHIYQYEWEWDEMPEFPIPYVRPKAVVHYGSPYITDYRMNWGWGGSHNNDYFSTTGNWVIDEDNFIYGRTILYNFSTL